jgi:hypothetical protein
MEKMIIQKKTLRFTVEVTMQEEGLKVNIIRFIDVGKNESMTTNAQLAKYDALALGTTFVNCHEILHEVVDGIQKKLPKKIKVNSQILLKKGQVFGCA